MTGRSLPVGALQPAIAALRSGGVVAVPTDTVYGLVGLASTPGIGAKLAAIKGRQAEVAVQVLVADTVQADQLAGPDGLAPLARRLAEREWPGGLTIVTERRPGLVLDLGGDPTSIGLRWPDHQVVVELCQAVGPLAATSANLHGHPPLTSAAEVAGAFGDELATVVDGGNGGAEASTVVDVRAGVPRLLRQGAVPWSRIAEAAGVTGTAGAGAAVADPAGADPAGADPAVADPAGAGSQ